MIEVQHLTKRYGRVTAVDDISFRVEQGEILGFLGPNGAGKTTTMRILTGFMPATEGKSIVAGFDVFDQPIEAKRRTGYLPETPPLYPDMTVVEYLTFVAKIKGVPSAERHQRRQAVMDRTRVSDMANRQCSKLSKGYKQRVGLAQALIHNPDVLILDEPTAGLDPLAARTVRELIVGLKHASRSIVLCTHDLDEAERLADRVAILAHGRIVASDSAAALRASASHETLVQILLAAPCAAAVSIAERVSGVSDPVFAQTPQGPLLVYRTALTQRANPHVIAGLVAAGARIVSVTCTTATLEDVYATAVGSAPTGVVGARP